MSKKRIKMPLKPPFRLLFAGSPALALPALEKLEKSHDFDVCGVITPSPKPFGRKKELKKSPVEVFAEEKGLLRFYADKKTDLLPIYELTKPDVALVIAFGILFPEEVLDFCPFGTLNVHFSLLPELRGASPVQSALLLGQKESGITLQKMQLALDEGDILWQRRFPLENRTTGELFSFFAEKTAENIEEVLKKYLLGEISPQKQSERAIKPTYCGKFTKKDGEIYKTDAKEDVLRKFRAFTPWPGIFLRLSEEKTLQLAEISEKRPEKSESVAIFFQDGPLYAQKLQISGKKALSAADFARGNADVVHFLEKRAF